VLRIKPTTVAMSSVCGSKLTHTTDPKLRGASDDTDAHRIKHAHNFYFILFVSSGLGMCDRLNSLEYNEKLNSLWRFRHSGVFVKELNTV